MRNWPNAVLMLDQRLRRRPTLNQQLVSVPCWLGKLLLSICWRLFPACFQSPTVTQPIVSQHKAHMRDVAQVYRVYMTWELALNAAMGMKRI